MSRNDWTAEEKRLARRAFDTALQRERFALLVEFKKKAEAANDFDATSVDRYHLKDKQRELDARYDYRYLRLVVVFAGLVRDGRISETELEGLSEDKLASIRAMLA